MKGWKGAVVAEGLSDPKVINNFSVYKVVITDENMLIDYEGNFGRWHIYWIRLSRKEIDDLQDYILRGWYAHFWDKNRIIVVYNYKQFELVRNDKNTWKEAIEHGKKQGILENELDFPTD